MPTPTSRRFIITPTALDAWFTLACWTFCVACVCSVIPSESHFRIRLEGGIAPLFAVGLGCLIATAIALRFGRVCLRDLFPLSSLLLAATGIYLWQPFWTNVALPDWSVNWLIDNRFIGASEPLPSSEQITEVVIAATVLAASSLISVTVGEGLAGIVGSLWTKNRAKLMISFMLLMLPTASIVNASFGSDVPQFLLVLAAIAGAIAMLPLSMALTVVVAKYFVSLPLRTATNRSHFSWSYLTVWAVLVLSSYLLWNIHFYEWIDLELQDRWRCFTILAGGGSFLLCLLSLAKPAEPDEYTVAQSPRAFSMWTFIPLGVTGFFFFQASYRHDLHTLITMHPKNPWQASRQLRMIHLESRGVIHPVSPNYQPILLIRPSKDCDSECLTALNHHSNLGNVDVLIFDGKANVDLTPVATAITVHLINGNISAKQLNELRNTRAVSIRGVEVPRIQLGDVDVSNIQLGEPPPSMGIGPFLEQYATQMDDSSLHLDCEPLDRLTWDKIKVASHRRAISVSYDSLPEWLLTQQEAETGIGDLSIDALPSRLPALWRFALLNNIEIGRNFWWARRRRTVWDNAFGSEKIPGLENSLLDRWIYERNQQGEAVAAWIPGGSLELAAPQDSSRKLAYRVPDSNWAETLQTLHLDRGTIFKLGFGDYSRIEKGFLQQLPNLRELYLSESEELTSPALAELAKASRLERLQIGVLARDTTDSTTVFSKLKNLHFIRFFCMPDPITCQELSSLENLSEVEIIVGKRELGNEAEIAKINAWLNSISVRFRDSQEFKAEVPESFERHQRELRETWLDRLNSIVVE